MPVLPRLALELGCLRSAWTTYVYWVTMQRKWSRNKQQSLHVKARTSSPPQCESCHAHIHSTVLSCSSTRVHGDSWLEFNSEIFSISGDFVFPHWPSTYRKSTVFRIIQNLKIHNLFRIVLKINNLFRRVLKRNNSFSKHIYKRIYLNHVFSYLCYSVEFSWRRR